jgi:hypothetical protein
MAGRKSKASLATQTELDQLRAALLEKTAQVEALRYANRAGQSEDVILQSCGYVKLVFRLDDGKSLILEAQGPKSTRRVPAHIYEAYKSDTDWFDMGYVRVVGEEIVNPNIILNVESWLADVTEGNAQEMVRQFTSAGPINKIWFHLMDKQDHTGLEMVIIKALRNRANELFDINLLQDV